MLLPVAQSGEPFKISVWLADKDEKSLKKFHCVVCGKIVFEYFSSVAMMLPGETDFTKAPVVIECHGSISIYGNGGPFTTRCKQKYVIQ